jgi:hypothetical protein
MAKLPEVKTRKALSRISTPPGTKDMRKFNLYKNKFIGILVNILIIPPSIKAL